MKPCTWDNPNKMHFDSDFKTFNKQTNIISHGNVWANTQTSSYIRPWKEVKNGGYIGQPGDFLKYDLRLFPNLPERFRRKLWDYDRNESYIVYHFHYYDEKHRQRETIGYVMCDYNHKLIDYEVYCGYGQSYWKRESAIRECIKYVCA